MNTQEKEQLSQFLNQLVEVKLTEKDSEAENLIRATVDRQPDAAYLLIQRCLLQDQALVAAQNKIDDLQKQLQKNTAPTSNSFLNGDPWASTPAPANSVPGASSYQIPASRAGADNPAFFRAAPPQNAGLGSGSNFLGNVATTAAGVVAGSFLFQGIGNLLGHHQSTPVQQASDEHSPEQTVINNYYGDDQLPSTGHDDFLLGSNDNDSLFDDGDSESNWV